MYPHLDFRSPKDPSGVDSMQKATCKTMILFFFKILFIYLERGEGREKERERNISRYTDIRAPTGGLARNPGMCPYQKSNWWPFGSQPVPQSTDQHQPGENYHSLDHFLHPWSCCFPAIVIILTQIGWTFFHGRLLRIVGGIPKKSTKRHPAGLDGVLGARRGPLRPAPRFVSGELEWVFLGILDLPVLR